MPRGTHAKTPNSRVRPLPGGHSASREKDATILHLIIGSLACGKTCRKGPGGDHRLSYAVLVRKQAVVASSSVCIVTIYDVLLLLLLRTYSGKGADCTLRWCEAGGLCEEGRWAAQDQSPLHLVIPSRATFA